MTDASDPDVRLRVTDELVAHLLTTQHPDLAHFEIGRHYAREVHTTVRIGDEWGVRFPTVAGLDAYYARSRPLLAGHRHQWTFPHSAPRRGGLPDDSFPFHWEVTGWIIASNASLVPLTDGAGTALGDALRQVHRPATAEAPSNPRTMPRLTEYAAAFGSLLATAQSAAPTGLALDTHALTTSWALAVQQPREEQDTWTHGRLEAQSVLCDQGTMAGIAMWEFFGAGDPAADLGMASALLPPREVEPLFGAYGAVTVATRLRARGYLIRALLRHATSLDDNVAREAWHGLSEYGYASHA